MSNDPNGFFRQQIGLANAAAARNYPETPGDILGVALSRAKQKRDAIQNYPETPGDILGVALSRAKQKRDAIQKMLDSVPKLKDDLANFDALIARLEGREDE